MSMTLHVSREGSDDEVTFADIIEDQRHLFAEPGAFMCPLRAHSANRRGAGQACRGKAVAKSFDCQ